MRMKHFVSIYVGMILLGFLFVPQVAYGENYTSCLGYNSDKKSCVLISKKDEEYNGQALWADCEGNYGTYTECKNAIAAQAEASGVTLYNLCYNTTDPLEAKCVTKDFSWVNTENSTPIEGYKCITEWVIQSTCEAKLTAYFAEEQKKQTTVCCIPPKSKKGEIACAEVTANFSNAQEVDAKCVIALGGDDNYQSRYPGKCSAASDCKNTTAKKKSGGGGDAGSSGGTGVAPTKSKVGGGNFIIDDLTDPFGNYTVPTLIGKIIKAALSVVGAIALVLFIYAGIMWMTASGNEERTRSAAKIMLWTVLGLVVIFASYILVNFVFSAL